MHYYRYKPDINDNDCDPTDGPQVPPPPSAVTSDDKVPMKSPNGPNASQPRIIDKTPVLSLLLEPRSLVITSQDLYTSHLHGLDGITEDIFAPHSRPNSKKPNEHSNPNSLNEEGIRVVNWEMVHDDDMKRVLAQGGVLKRGTRTSLTCRVVEKVRSLGGGIGNGGFGGKRR